MSSDKLFDDTIRVFPHLFNNKHEINFLLDSNFNILSITDPSLEAWLNVSHIKIDDLIGKNLYHEFFLQYNVYKEDLDLISDKLSAKDHFHYIGINFRRNNKYKILLFEYKQILNGSIIHGRGYVPKLPLNWYYLQSFTSIPKNSSYIEDTTTVDKNMLTTREQEVLFLMFHFHSYEEIASIINLFHQQKTTPNAIGKLVRRSIYEKLNVINLISLKQRAFELKYHLNIPTSLFPEILIEIPE